MVNYDKPFIFVVEAEPRIRTAARNFLEKLGCRVSCFSCAQDCLEQLRFAKCDLLIADAQLPDLDGIELINEVKRIAPWQGILAFVHKGDAPTAVQAIKAGALNFIEKPLQSQNFLSVVNAALKETNFPDPLLGKELTGAEAEVLHLILEGKSNKEVARLRHRSVRTIEDQRRRIMRKLGVDNVVDLVKRAVAMGLIEL
jgi:FixJ family two-component response regulator